MENKELIEKYGTTQPIYGCFFFCHPAGAVMIRFSTIHHYQWDDDRNTLMITFDSGKHSMFENLVYSQVKQFQESYTHWLFTETGHNPAVKRELIDTLKELEGYKDAYKLADKFLTRFLQYRSLYDLNVFRFSRQMMEEWSKFLIENQDLTKPFIQDKQS